MDTTVSDLCKQIGQSFLALSDALLKESGIRDAEMVEVKNKLNRYDLGMSTMIETLYEMSKKE